MSAGKGKLFRDSKIGNIVNAAIAGGLMYLANAVGKFDVTPLPDAVEPAIAALLALAGGILTSKALARGATAAPARTESPERPYH